MHSDNMPPLLIKSLSEVSELRGLITVFVTAFESEYKVSDEYLSAMLHNSSCVILGALIDDRIVGGLVAFEMTPIHGTKEFYIYDIAVHPEFQKQGIGTRLMEALKQEARTRGVGTIFVEAESEDEGAVAFYRAIDGEEVAVNHFNFTL